MGEGTADLSVLLEVCDGPPDATQLFLVFQLSIEQAQTVAEQVEMKAKVVQSEVKAVTARHKKALEERECELLWKVMGRARPPHGRTASAGQHFFREPRVRTRTPALNLDDLVVFQSSTGRKKSRGPWRTLWVLSRQSNNKNPFQKVVGYHDWKESRVFSVAQNAPKGS